jgi:DNA polymerase
MKPSEYSKLVELVKNHIEEETNWLGSELVTERDPVKTPPVKSGKAASRGGELEKFKDAICGCQKCPLGKSRLNFVFGTGNPRAELMFVGEGPGFDEDHKGEPFIGRAGQQLNKIIEAMGLKREEVYIANIVKCHPMIDPTDPEKRGNDRPPTPEETMTCLPYLEKQIELIRPKVICSLGSPASKTLSGLETPISKLRGTFIDYVGTSEAKSRHLSAGIKLMPTYHPAALLRNPVLKKDVWEDVKQIMKVLGIQRPSSPK